MPNDTPPLIQTIADTLIDLKALAVADDRSLTSPQLITKFLATVLAMVAVFTAFYHVVVGVYNLAQYVLSPNRGAGRLPGLVVLAALLFVAFAIFWAIMVRARVGLTWTGVAEERVRQRIDEEHGRDSGLAGQSKES
ncbi:hypothetical protein PRZ48_010051 [Zasmidium cellare]|uniref:Uncharacterized protein n=1 Tax=Zasmidium cellare TaxID=395010 RepID=A0ABR0EDF8_ZASCE|nr:hypothetical protein PRZ48_010051 [Zasmidium cellare]